MKKIVFISIFAASALLAANIEFKNADNDFKRINPEFDTDVVISYHDSVSSAKKSVVNISTKKVVSSSPHGSMDGLLDDPFFRQFFGFNFGIPQEKTRQFSSLGSGVIISNDGYIVTNNHVVEDADEILVNLSDDDKEYKAKVVGTDPKTDIAIIKIDAKNLEAIKFADSSKLLEGDMVFAIGNPFGVGSTITQGIISALNKSNIGLNQYENFIQTDASINPGNSGGALVDSRGALIGINSAILSRGGGNNGVGFAIPSNMVKDIAKQLISDGKIQRGYIGVMISDLTKEQKDVYKNSNGALIISIEKDMPADKAGLKRGDLVIKANDKDIKSANDLKNLIGSLTPNKNINIEYERGGKVEKTSVKLADMDSGKTSQASTTGSKESVKGLKVNNLSEDIRYKYNISQDINGVLVVSVDKDSDGFKAGFSRGDVIIQVGDKEVKNIDEFNTAIAKNKDKKTLIWVIRNGVPQGLVINNK
ncbi:Do family serine endopeptidase [Campylobacter geochelonis]|uniref:Peptidase S1C, Do n=1 Tax=Campylobacter geochelonis TaxID=1780362 RepID=A0A128EQ09_9BACT|nr:Do family serine endopeptidase [Campylobacter geochelonis]QKF71461.1 periplasmic heat shock serine protease HtrA, Do family [Campylobacter geochelonis]CZE47889.1 peptidase S1C%2C Do [Campylobacter geochelonis]CZE48301.1 peptidase S1C%2C Do [Campylobacter geochelonis]CZE50823.1 peptidase S1C%2C Do [Campylobacter geochelonis]